MLMNTEYIYTEARISKSIVGEQWETDGAGNPIIIIEASNENLDFEGEKVLRSALLNSKDYFLQNGVISYDHKHLPSPDNHKWDPEWNAEKYVLGQPMDAWEGKNDKGKKVVKVKAVLSRSNAIAKEIIGKLSDGIGTIKASVGGRKVKKAIKMDTHTYKDVPTIVQVNWDEVALTYKPVNQTLGATVLCPKGFVKSEPAFTPDRFVKSLTAGSESTPGKMGTGGNTLQVQSLQRKPVISLMEKIRSGDIKKSCDAITHLVNSGFSQEEAGNVLKVIIDKKYIGDIIMADGDDVNAVINDSTDELEKALNDFEGGGETLIKGLDKMKDDGMYKMKGGHMYMKKAGKWDKVDDDSPDYNGDDDDDDDMGKSIDTGDDLGGDFIDATKPIEDMKKSISTLNAETSEIKTMLKSVLDNSEKQNTLMKAIGVATQKDSVMLKAISEAPLPRQTTNGNLNTQERFSKSMVDKLALINAGTLAKSMGDAGIDGVKMASVNNTFRNHGIQGVAQVYPEIAEMLVKEK